MVAPARNIGLRHSPSWHRRLRKRRSRARALTRAGGKLSLRQKAALLRHHGTPPSQACTLHPWSVPRALAPRDMGGKKQQWQDGWASAQPSWQLWRGARSPQQRPWRSTQGRVDQSGYFPAFDSLQVTNAEDRVDGRPGKESVQPTARHQMLRDLQSMVNGARKAETRLARAVAAREKTQAQWQKFLSDMKASYLREHKRYENAMNRHDKEVADANEGQEQVYGIIRQTAFGRAEEQAIADMEVEGFAENEQIWDSMRQAWDVEAGDSAEDVLRRALGSAMGAATTSARSGGLPVPPVPPEGTNKETAFAQPLLTPRRSTGAPPRTPKPTPRPATIQEEHAQVDDPYPAPSPSPTEMLTPTLQAAMSQMTVQPPQSAAPPSKSPAAHPGQRDLSRLRVPTAVDPPRKDIKSATMQVPKAAPAAGLGQKLDAKCQQILDGAALRPFRGKGQGGRDDAQGTRPVQIQNDDESSEDDAMEAEALSEPPGEDGGG